MITCVGAAHIDEVVRLDHALHPGASNPARWSQSIGGVAANVCLAAGSKTDAILLAAVGDDANGFQLQSYFQSHLPSQPVGALHTLPDLKTGRYCAVLDQDGELIIGLAETDIAEKLTYQDIASLLKEYSQPSDILVVDANLSHQCLRDMCTHKSTPMLVALTVSPVKAMRLADLAGSIDLLITNRREASALTGLPVQTEPQRLSDALTDAGFMKHVMTDGANEILIRTQQHTTTVPVTAGATVAGVNGAGDALAGATLAGLAQGLSLVDAVSTLGITAAQRIVTGKTSAPALHSKHS